MTNANGSRNMQIEGRSWWENGRSLVLKQTTNFILWILGFGGWRRSLDRIIAKRMNIFSALTNISGGWCHKNYPITWFLSSSLLSTNTCCWKMSEFQFVSWRESGIVSIGDWKCSVLAYSFVKCLWGSENAWKKTRVCKVGHELYPLISW